MIDVLLVAGTRRAMQLLIAGFLDRYDYLILYLILALSAVIS